MTKFFQTNKQQQPPKQWFKNNGSTIRGAGRDKLPLKIGLVQISENLVSLAQL